LPSYEEGTDTHLFYNYELLRSVSGRLDVFVIIEKCSTPSVAQSVAYLGTRYYAQKFKNPILRFLEIFFVIKFARLRGYKDFYSHYSYYGALASWFITKILGGRSFYWNRGMPWLFKRSFFEEKIFRFILTHTILVTSPETLAQEYKKIYGVKEHRIFSNWIDIERYKPAVSKEEAKKSLGLDIAKKYVLFVHHLSQRKGADFIAPVAEKFGEDVVFLVAGDGDYMAKLKEEAKSLRGGGVVLLGKVPQSKVVQYFHASDVFFMPSREEGSPHVILEAMAAETPFVASRVGGVLELVPPAQEEFICNSEDIDCFYKSIRTFLENKTKYGEARDGIKFWVHRFSKERGVEEFVNLFTPLEI